MSGPPLRGLIDRYRELLPVGEATPVVTLGEGGTPLVPLTRLSERLGIDFSKFVVTLDRYGNTAAASVLIAFDDLVTSGRAAAGDLVVLVVFGGGLSWAATLIRL